MNGELILSWEDIYEGMTSCPPGKVYGVPRGGQVIAGMTGRAVNRPHEADVIVDDIIDSGRTRDEWKKIFPDKPFWALVDKTNWEANRPWIVFPWEKTADAGIESNVTRLIEFIGEDPNRDGLKETPARVAKSLRELTCGYSDVPEKILAKVFEVAYDEMVTLRSIPFWSLCEHHMLPFHGVVDVAYIPSGKVVGISKLARLVNCFARRLQVQERMTQQIAQAIQTVLKPQGVGVVVRASHTCMAMRGVNKAADMVTSCLLGLMREDARARSEFLGFVRNGGTV